MEKVIKLKNAENLGVKKSNGYIMLGTVRKLVTKEDPYFIHKILGVVSFCNFVYRYYLLLSYGEMMMTSPIDIALITCHGALSASSLIFHIPKKRHATLPMIYPEFRLHSIAFGLRSVVCCFIDYYGNEYKLYYKMAACIGTMGIADTITKSYAEPGDTTMRAMPFASSTSIEERNKITRFHSNSQIFATLLMLYNMETAFSPLFAIQIAAFLMTMVRKGFINPNTWHILYSLALMINVFTSITLLPSDLITICIAKYMFSHMRFQMKMNKYIGWLIIFGLIRNLNISFIDKYDTGNYTRDVMTLYYLVQNFRIIDPLFFQHFIR